MTIKSSLQSQYQAQVELVAKNYFSAKDINLSVINKYHHKFGSFYNNFIAFFDSAHFFNLFIEDIKVFITYSSITAIAAESVKANLNTLSKNNISLSDYHTSVSPTLIEEFLLNNKTLKLSLEILGLHDTKRIAENVLTELKIEQLLSIISGFKQQNKNTSDTSEQIEVKKNYNDTNILTATEIFVEKDKTIDSIFLMDFPSHYICFSKNNFPQESPIKGMKMTGEGIIYCTDYLGIDT